MGTAKGGFALWILGELALEIFKTPAGNSAAPRFWFVSCVGCFWFVGVVGVVGCVGGGVSGLVLFLVGCVVVGEGVFVLFVWFLRFGWLLVWLLGGVLLVVAWVLGGVGLVEAVVGAGAALGAWRSARESAVASSRLAEVEAGRRHEELTPRFELTELESLGRHGAFLGVFLVGPGGLVGLERVRLEVDEGQPSFRGYWDPGEERVEAQVWAPYMFDPERDDVSVDGRSMEWSGVEVGDGMIFRLLRVPMPDWFAPRNASPARWAEEERHWRRRWKTVRLRFRCFGADGEEWVVRKSVYTPAGLKFRG